MQVNATITFDAENLILEMDGTLGSDYISFDGSSRVQFMINGNGTFEFVLPFCPRSIGVKWFSNSTEFRELEGKLKISFVENEVAGIPLPGHANYVVPIEMF